MRWLLTWLLLCGCSKEHERAFQAFDHWMRTDSKVKVLSTTAMIGDLVQQVGGEHVVSIILIERGLDPHTYEIVKGDDEKIACGDVIFANGLGLECGASLRYLLEKRGEVVYVAEEIAKRCPEEILYFEGQVDPHVWTDVLLWSESIDAIVQALSDKDSQHAEVFQTRGKALKERLLCLHQRLMNEISSIPEKRRYLVTSHDAFHYFSRRYLGGIDRCMSPEGLAPESQISTQDIREMVAFLQRVRVPVIFPETNVSKQSLNKILSVCQKCGLSLAISDDPLYGDAMGDYGSAGGSYEGMMEENVRILKKELMR